MARDAMEFTKAVIESHRVNEMEMDAELADDLAALIISKTGANAALFVSGSDPRLTLLPEGILSTLADRMEQGGEVAVEQIWPKAA